MNSLIRAGRWSSGLVLVALVLTVGACSDSTQPTAPTTTTTTVPQSAPATTPTTTAPSFSTARDLVAALGTAWMAGDEATLTQLVPASASELLGWGQPEFVNAVLIPDCTLGSDGTGSCELLVGIDGTGLLFNMKFSEASDGGLQIDQVEFAGDAG